VNPKFSSRRKSYDDVNDLNRFDNEENFSQNDHSLIAAAAEDIESGRLMINNQHNFANLIANI
jgi:hypothetical protein